MRILAVLGIEVTACVTILDRATRRPPACGARLHTGREAPKSSKRGNESCTAIHSLPMKRFQKTAVAYGADLLAFELNGEVVSGLPGHHSLENLVLSWARRVVGDDCLEIHVLLMFF